MTARILIRAGRDPRTAVDPVAALAARGGRGDFGANTGNLLYQWGAFRTLATADLAADGLRPESGRMGAAAIEEAADHYVIPLANAFRPSFVTPLDRLTATIRKLTIPVTILGVGMQLKLDQTFADIDDETNRAARDFAHAVLERGPTIGVRGAVTADYLAHLGVDAGSIDVIGCPSLFLHGPELTVRSTRPLADTSSIALNVTPSATGAIPLIDHAVRTYPNLVYVPQEHTDLTMMLWGIPRADPRDKRIPTHRDHLLYTEDRMRAFVDAPSWIGFLSGREFAFGTRIHGNIAALVAGTPAFVLAHDHRTKELAEHHRIPHRALTAIDETTTLAELHAEADPAALNAAHPGNYATYRAFLARHGLPGHTADHGADHTADPARRHEFDEAVAATRRGPIGITRGDALDQLGRLYQAYLQDRKELARLRAELTKARADAPAPSPLRRLARRILRRSPGRR